MNILYIAYSCSPYGGSEEAIGFNIPIEMSKNNNVYVITKEESVDMEAERTSIKTTPIKISDKFCDIMVGTISSYTTGDSL